MSGIRQASVLSTGTVSQTWTDPLPINVCVIEYEAGLVLFDAGRDRASVTDYRRLGGAAPRRHLRLDVEWRSLASRSRS
jgi:hypothetical protein